MNFLTIPDWNQDGQADFDILDTVPAVTPSHGSEVFLYQFNGSAPDLGRYESRD